MKSGWGIPYLRGLFEETRRILKDMGLKVDPKMGNNIVQIVVTKKRMIDQPKKDEATKKDVVYSVPCGGCNKIYVGQTGKSMQVRVKQRETNIKNNKMMSTLTNHCHIEGHIPDFSSAKVEGEEKNLGRRLQLEGFVTALTGEDRAINAATNLYHMKGWASLLSKGRAAVT